METNSIHSFVISQAHKSVFVKSLSRIPLKMETLKETFLQFGLIERVICKPEHSYYAIVEFVNEENAQLAILQRRVFIDEVEVEIGERRLILSRSQLETPKIEIDEIIEEARNIRGFNEQLKHVGKRLEATDQDMAYLNFVCDRLTKCLNNYFSSLSVVLLGAPGMGVAFSGLDTSEIEVAVNFNEIPGSMRDGKLTIDLERDSEKLLSEEPSMFIDKPVHGDEMSRMTEGGRTRLLFHILIDAKKDTTWLGLPRAFLEMNCPFIRVSIDKTIQCDIFIQTNLTSIQTGYIRSLISKDSSLNIKHYLLGFRFWTIVVGFTKEKARKEGSTITPYLIYLLVIFTLRREGVIPVSNEQFISLKQEDGSFFLSYGIPSFDTSPADFQLIIKRMFEFFTNMEMRQTALSSRNGTIRTLEEVMTQYPHFVSSTINMQDVIDPNVNVTSNISTQLFSYLLERMSEAVRELDKQTDFAGILSEAKKRRCSCISIFTEFDVSCNTLVPTDSQMIDVLAACAMILEEVAGLQPIYEEQMSWPEIDEDFHYLGVFSLYTRLWLGRRNLRRKAEQNLTPFELEKMVSQRLLKHSPGDATVIITVAVAAQLSQSNLKISFSLIEGTENDLNDFVLFFQDLLDNCLMSILAGASFTQ